MLEFVKPYDDETPKNSATPRVVKEIKDEEREIDRRGSLSPLNLDTTMRTVEQTETISVLGNGAMRISPYVCDLPSEAASASNNEHSSFLQTGVLVLKTDESKKLINGDKGEESFFNSNTFKAIVAILVAIGLIVLLLVLVEAI